MLEKLQKKLIDCRYITNDDTDRQARYEINNYLQFLLQNHDVDRVIKAIDKFSEKFKYRIRVVVQNKPAYLRKILEDTLYEEHIPDVTFKTEPHPLPGGGPKIDSDLVSRARTIFIEYDGNNRNEIFELRKLWEPKCSKCGSVMEFWKFTEEFKIGHAPASIFKCPNCTNYYHVEVSRKQEACGAIRPTTVIWDYSENPGDWSDEVLAKILASIFKEKKL